MARILIVGGGCRGRKLSRELVERGDAVRVTTREESGRAAIEQTGAECWIGTPDRLGTLRGALENVTIVCWLLGAASGTPEQLEDLHGSRLEFFLSQAIDTTVRGFVYECTGPAVSDPQFAEGRRILTEITARNEIPAALIDADPLDIELWLPAARAAIEGLLGQPSGS